MSVKGFEKDEANLTMTATAEFEATVEEVWRLWKEPRLLERWWGPPGYPATFTEHDLEPGGRAAYFMSGPDGEKYPGWWRVISVEPPRRVEFEDGFADEDGKVNEEMPASVTAVTIETGDTPGTVVMTMTSTFGSIEAMREVIEMGAEEGLVSGINQIDPLLEELRA